MKRVHILVEGQTEEAFTRDVLTPHLYQFGIHPIAVLLKTKRVKSGGTFKGGVTTTEQVLGDVRRLLTDTAAVAVTTLLDYYGLPQDFPGMALRPTSDPYARVACVEAAFAAKIDSNRFLPHLVLHEYETWIFSAPGECGWVFERDTVATRLSEIALECNGAERINEQPMSAPSKRLQKVFPAYKKTLHGPMAVEAIGLERIRQACPHAAAWLSRLESLGSE